MTPRDRGYQSITSLSTSGTTEGNVRDAWALPAWLQAPGSAANLQLSSAALSHCRPTGARVWCYEKYEQETIYPHLENQRK